MLGKSQKSKNVYPKIILENVYSVTKYKQPWKQKVTELVLLFEDDYFKCIKKYEELLNLEEKIILFFQFLLELAEKKLISTNTTSTVNKNQLIKTMFENWKKKVMLAR